MALNGKLQHRHIVASNTRTTLALEPEFWLSLERIAEGNGITWQQWTKEQLGVKPIETGRASWLRLSVLASLAH